MPECGYRVYQEHPWSGKTHHFTHFIPVWFLIAVHRALCTGRLIRHKGTVRQTGVRISQQLLAIGTQPASSAMLRPAIQTDHVCNRSLFLLKYLCRFLLFRIHNLRIVNHFKKIGLIIPWYCATLAVRCLPLISKALSPEINS